MCADLDPRLVIYLSLTPDPPDLGAPEGLKVGHLLAYGWLMIWFAQIHRTTGRRMMLAVGFCALGILLEYLQGVTDYRGFEYSDMVINSTGVARTGPGAHAATGRLADV
jgi:hypothetical protein